MTQRRAKLIRALQVVSVASSVAFLLCLLTPGVAFADDCETDPLNAADCMRTPGPRRTMTTTIGVTATASTVATNVLSSEEGPESTEEEEEEEEKEEEPAEEDPCAGERAKFELEKANLRVLLASRAKMDSFLTFLDNEYENTRQSAYWSGAVDIAMLAGSVFGRAARAGMGWAVQRTLMQNIGVSLATAFGKQVAKGILNDMTAAGITPESIAKMTEGSVQSNLMKKIISDAVLKDQMQTLGQGLDPNGPVYNAVERGVKTNWAGPAANLYGDTMSLLSIGKGMWSGKQRLEMIRAQMSKVRSHLSQLESDIEDTRMEVDLTKHSLGLCESSERYQRYLRRQAVLKLPSMG
jgi:hypothetical protein